MDSLNLLILLVLGHFVCDFVLQSDRMAVEKMPGRDSTLHWSWWLGSHAATHGPAVALLTDVPLLGMMETLLHAMINGQEVALASHSLWTRAFTCSANWRGFCF